MISWYLLGDNDIKDNSRKYNYLYNTDIFLNTQFILIEKQKSI